MRILLIDPAKAPRTLGGEDYFLYEPLALEYVAAPLVADHDVRILDQRLDKNVRRTLEKFKPDIVGITSYTVHVNPVRKLFEEVNLWNPDVLTVVGGHHATVVPTDFRSPSIDLIVSGDGVSAFQDIVRRHEKGEEFGGIPGVSFRRNGDLLVTDPEPHPGLDTLPFPARHLTAKYRKHYYSEWMKPLASIRTSRGCPFRCNFCALWKLTGGRYLKRDPGKIVEELAGIEEEYVFFADDESLVDASRMMRLAQKIKETGLNKRYFLYGRSDTIAKHPELLEAWKAIGLERVFVGFEFFRDEDLEYIHKGSTAEDNEKAVKILQDLDIEIYASFILRPEFTREDFLRFGDYCRGLNLNFVSFAVLTPLPGTDLYAEVRDRMITHEYDYFDFIHTLLPTALPLREFYEEYYQLYRRSVSFSNGMKLMRKFPVWKWPHVTERAFHWYSRLRNAYKDYRFGK
jgi:radical SAM superfamily enzyme YgiQ (UPF0313 family)